MPIHSHRPRENFFLKQERVFNSWAPSVPSPLPDPLSLPDLPLPIPQSPALVPMHQSVIACTPAVQRHAQSNLLGARFRPGISRDKCPKINGAVPAHTSSEFSLQCFVNPGHSWKWCLHSTRQH
ncbi:hypothetical protein KIL84_014495 [Mauremys mutica]|uniref:Uncharacterized protein n=1 Tax=Mauremys mutica TaxID=74926 RepID=A0A9D3XLV2_9SAUR|nr:hypothetical protein KIL84_014495 [Mauremys mutica]